MYMYIYVYIYIYTYIIDNLEALLPLLSALHHNIVSCGCICIKRVCVCVCACVCVCVCEQTAFRVDIQQMCVCVCVHLNKQRFEWCAGHQLDVLQVCREHACSQSCSSCSVKLASPVPPSAAMRATENRGTHKTALTWSSRAIAP